MPGDGTTLYAPKHPKGSNTKGGGYRGGPKRWTGSGPRPARHIPWPEIFKHHISILEGHLKMVDMIRKHTVPDTGNWRTINQMVLRSQELLRMSKEATRNFVPPPDHREKVPIGSSSASMYPGYSPADHQYGEAAQEFGSEWSAAKAKGIEFKPAPDGPEYQFGQAKGVKRRTLAKIREAKAARGEGSGSGTGSGSGSGSGSDTAVPPAVSNGSAPKKVYSKAKAAEEKAEDQSGDGNNPYFVIDVNPTPVNIPGVSVHLPKRTSEGQPESATVEKKPKKPKQKHEGSLPGAAEKKVEFEDISDEVDARLKEKEERRKRKEEKKRKRDSDGSAVVQAIAEVPKPLKKKTKETVEGKGTVDGTNPKKRVASAEHGNPQDESKPKKKSKKSKA